MEAGRIAPSCVLPVSHPLRKEEKRMEKAVTRRKWTAGLLIAGTVALVVAFWSLIMSMLSLLAVAGVLTLLSLPLCKVLEKRLPSGAAARSPC